MRKTVGEFELRWDDESNSPGWVDVWSGEFLIGTIVVFEGFSFHEGVLPDIKVNLLELRDAVNKASDILNG
jgi:hypothetical protein